MREIRNAAKDIRTVKDENLLQLDMEPEDDLALSYLVEQFPAEYAVAEKPKPGPSQAQIDAQEKKELLDYSNQVVDDARAY